MKPTVSIHNIDSVDLGAIRHFPVSGDNPAEFWTRVLTLVDAKGDRFSVELFADTPGGLRTAGEVTMLKLNCRTSRPCGLCAWCKAKEREAEEFARLGDTAELPALAPA